MDITFTCPHCQQSLAVDESAAGQTVPCPTCAKEIVIPTAVIPAPPQPSFNRRNTAIVGLAFALAALAVWLAGIIQNPYPQAKRVHFAELAFEASSNWQANIVGPQQKHLQDFREVLADPAVTGDVRQAAQANAGRLEAELAHDPGEIWLDLAAKTEQNWHRHRIPYNHVAEMLLAISASCGVLLLFLKPRT